MAGKINKKLIQKEIFKNKNVQKLVRSIVEQEVNKQKNIFEKNFENHPVSQEISGGENASNLSGTLGGYGNLFSFLGFSVGSNPLTVVKGLIQKISISKNIRTSGNLFQVTVSVPSKEEFGSITRMPWESGRSWLLDIERGISGLSSYLYGRFQNSRSGAGIQSRYKYSNRVFRPTKYFSQLYNNFLKNIGAK
jgi:hypothetical protein